MRCTELTELLTNGGKLRKVNDGRVQQSKGPETTYP